MIRPLIRLGIAAALTVTLVGCGSETDDGAETTADPTSPTTPAAVEKTPDAIKPASGDKLATRGFSVRLPRGWADITGDAPDGVALSGADVGADENPAMLIVRYVRNDPSTARAAESAAVRGLESDGVTRVRPLDRLEVAGAAATHVRGVRSGGGVQVMLDQFTVLSDTGTWEITFSTNRWQVDKDRQRMIDSVLATVSLG